MHVVGQLESERPISEVVGSFSKFTARRINEHLGRKGRFWKKTFYDRNTRSHEELENQITYILNNPVEAGYVIAPEDWPWSESFPEWETLPVSHHNQETP